MGLVTDKLHTSNVQESGTAKSVVPKAVDDRIRNASEFRMSSAQGIRALGQIDRVRFAQESDSSGRNPLRLVICGTKLSKGGT